MDDQREELQRVTEEEGGLETNVEDILANQIVCKKIASYLSLADMKAASEVSRPFLQAIRGTKRFKQTAVLVISKKNLEVKSMIRKTKFEWRGVKVDGTDPSDILEDLPRLLKSTEFVCLEARPWEIEPGKLVENNPTAASLLTAVLSSTPNLAHLKMDIRLFFANLQAVLSSPAVQETLRKLDHLDLVMLAVPGRVNLDNLEDFVSANANAVDVNELARNARLLMELPNRLKSLNLADLSLSFSLVVVDSCVLRLLRKNRATLGQLSLYMGFWDIQELQTLVLPALKTLTTHYYAEESQRNEDGDFEKINILPKFLNNQKSLEELTLACDSLDERLVASIGGRSGKLKKLDLTFSEFPETVDWSCLARMTCLKEFRFDLIGNIRGTKGVGARLLTLLPNNQLTSLSLEGPEDGESKFWRADGVEAALEFKTELLRGFRCLRKLRLVGWENAVDDQLMQWLLKELSLLEELEISDCEALSNVGLSGDTRAKWGRKASLSDLRGLRTLKIWGCVGVTPEGLVSSVKLPFLKSLEYFNQDHSVPEWVSLELVRQNPRLERLRLNFHEDLLGKLKGKLMNPLWTPLGLWIVCRRLWSQWRWSWWSRIRGWRD